MKFLNFLKPAKINYKKCSMLNEILEQPSVWESITSKYDFDNLDKIDLIEEDLNLINNVYIIASGSSKNVGDIVRYFFEKATSIPTFCEYASEFAHKNPCIKPNDMVILISQSGETADTYESLKVAKSKNAITLALTNNPNSKIHNLAKYKIYIEAGEENSIAATKSFSAQLINMFLLGLIFGTKIIPEKNINIIKAELKTIKNEFEKILKQEKSFKKLAQKLKKYKNIALMGRGTQAYVAKEGALKLKEICYIDANGYPSGEFLHGHFAFIDNNTPLISIIDKNDAENYELAINNTKEVAKKRKPLLIIIKNEKDTKINNIDEFKNAMYINFPDLVSDLAPIFTAVCLQFLTFNLAKSLKRNIDKPRSLSKVVSQE